MERKHFIKTSLFGAAGLSLLPTVVKSMSFANNASVVLEENRHIRHGYYGNECTINRIGIKNKMDVRLDRFSNPEGDLTLIDVTYDNQQFRLGITETAILVEKGTRIQEIAGVSVEGKIALTNSEKVVLTSIDYLKAKNIEVKYTLTVDNQECRVFKGLTASTYSGRKANAPIVAFL